MKKSSIEKMDLAVHAIENATAILKANKENTLTGRRLFPMGLASGFLEDALGWLNDNMGRC